MTASLERVLRSLVFLALNPWLGLIGLLVVVIGVSLSAALGITVIGAMAMLCATLWIARSLGRVQCRHLGLAGAADIEPARRRRRSGAGLWSRLAGPLSDSDNWRAFAFWTMEPFLGVLTFSLTFALLCAGLVGVSLPLYASRLHGVGDDLPGLALAFGCLAGLLALGAAAVGSVAAVGAHAALARWLLGPGRTRELEDRVSDLGQARSAAIDAAESERRRIERDLHDGAQQRLVSLAMDLGLAREKFETDPGAARRLVEDAHAEAKATMAELRSLTRGLRPSVLEDRGLDAALSALAARCPVPVDISVQLERRPPPAVESAAYFVVAEALTNVARHAGASRAAVHISGDDLLVVEVSDDGRGDARTVSGGGLDGLAERVAGFEGRLTITSPAGGGTVLRAEIPCAS